MRRILSLILAAVILTIAIPTLAYPIELMGNDESKIYHRIDCRTIKYPERNHWTRFTSTEQAISAGYRACKICHP
ncbi:MAG: nuclease [Selenomonadaceae bacterium]|nr:nuclease [Selenomonadaceae bacterium]